MKPILVYDVFKNNYSQVLGEEGIHCEIAHSVSGAKSRLESEPEGFSLLLIDPASHRNGTQIGLRDLMTYAMREDSEGKPSPKLPVLVHTTIGPKLLEDEMNIEKGSHYVGYLRKEEPENTEKLIQAIMLYALQ